MKETINKLAQEIHQNATEKGWHSEPREFGTVMMLCACELAEAMEEYRNGEKPGEIYYIDGKPEGIDVELADCIIRILDYCCDADIDIGKAIEIKNKYNKTRSYRHGGKKC